MSRTTGIILAIIFIAYLSDYNVKATLIQTQEDYNDLKLGSICNFIEKDGQRRPAYDIEAICKEAAQEATKGECSNSQRVSLKGETFTAQLARCENANGEGVVCVGWMELVKAFAVLPFVGNVCDADKMSTLSLQQQQISNTTPSLPSTAPQN